MTSHERSVTPPVAASRDALLSASVRVGASPTEVGDDDRAAVDGLIGRLAAHPLRVASRGAAPAGGPDPSTLTPATRIRRATRSGTIRRANLTAVGGGLDEGLVATGSTRPVVGDAIEGGGLPGRIYERALGRCADKAAALRAAAAEAGRLGALVDAWGRENMPRLPMKEWEAQKMYTVAPPVDAAVPTEGKYTLDPFFHRVVVPYGPEGEDPRTLTLEYQHAKSLQGYVAKITDTSSAPMSRARQNRGRANSTGVAMYKGGRNRLQPDDYDQQHQETEERGLLGLTLDDAPDEFGKDAYTKLVGEGARWICVRDNMAQLRDTTKFYIVDPTKDDQAFSVTFRVLWVSWKSVFEKAFDISNDTVGKQLVANPDVKSGLKFRTAEPLRNVQREDGRALPGNVRLY